MSGYIYYEIIDNNNHKIIKISFYIVDNFYLVKLIPYVRQFYTESESLKSCRKFVLKFWIELYWRFYRLAIRSQIQNKSIQYKICSVSFRNVHRDSERSFYITTGISRKICNYSSIQHRASTSKVPGNLCCSWFIRIGRLTFFLFLQLILELLAFHIWTLALSLLRWELQALSAS